MDYIVAFDQGTTSSRCVIFDREAKMVSMAQEEIHRYFPRPGWVEQDAMEIWSSQIGMYTKALMKAHLVAQDIEAIGITNQRETTIIWDKRTGKPVCRAPVWQCRRGAPLIDKLVAAGHTDMIRTKTGLVPDAYFSASKIRWILDNIEGARKDAEAGHLLFGTVDSWLMWKMTEGAVHVTDYTNASRTMLFNIHTLAWDSELLDLFDIPASLLPEVRSSLDIFGATVGGSGSQIPICGVLGDQQAALLGQCCFDSGQAKATYGTGCFVLMNTGDKAVISDHGLLSTIAFSWQDDNAEKPSVTYALEGSIYNAGSVIKWLRDELHMIRTEEETEELVRSVSDNAGVYFVPAFNGIGAPYWNSNARGLITGLTQGATRAHIVRAALESVGFRVYDILQAMAEDAQMPFSELRVDGGVSRNNAAMQFQSDLLGTEVIRPQVIETTALGVAFAAGLGSGFWDSPTELRKLIKIDRTFTPSRDAEEMRSLKAGWDHAIKQVQV